MGRPEWRPCGPLPNQELSRWARSRAHLAENLERLATSPALSFLTELRLDRHPGAPGTMQAALTSRSGTGICPVAASAPRAPRAAGRAARLVVRAEEAAAAPKAAPTKAPWSAPTLDSSAPSPIFGGSTGAFATLISGAPGSPAPRRRPHRRPLAARAAHSHSRLAPDPRTQTLGPSPPQAASCARRRSRSST